MGSPHVQRWLQAPLQAEDGTLAASPRSDQDLSDLARRINPVVQGWINYYGRFYRSALYRSLRGINEYLTR